MWSLIKRQWRGLKGGEPGRRFQDAYTKARREPSPLWHRLVSLGLAIVALVLGVIFAFIPGPAVVFFAVAGALLAAESRRLAVILDWIELRLRELGHWAKRHWQRLGLIGRVVVVTVGASGSVAMMALTAWMFFSVRRATAHDVCP